MKVLLIFVILFFSTTYSQNVVSLSLGNKWFYDYHYYSSSDDGFEFRYYQLEKEVVGNTYISGVPYAKIKVNKIEEGDTSFVQYEYWHADSLVFLQIGMDLLLDYIPKIFDLSFTNDSIGIDHFIGLEVTTVLGESVLLQKFYYEESGMASFSTTVETAQNIGVSHIYGDGDVDTGGLRWNCSIVLYKALIDGTILTSVENNENSHPNFALSQNYPNPFNPTTKIKYQIKEPGFVSLKVYDILGKKVATLVNEHKNPGYYSVTFDANSAAGGLPSGVYIYKLQAGKYSSAKKMLLTK